jgi:hypothetical protein
MLRHIALAWMGLVLVAAFACSGKSKPADITNTGSGSATTGSATQPVTTQCTVDTDCRAVADYCTGCDCRVLAASAPDPTCDGPGVKCFADPCMGKVARCEAGTCTTAAATAP